MPSEELVFKARRRSIGLTALIDVVFILLMFFMLTSSFNRWRAIDFHPLVAADSSVEQQNQVVLLHQDLSLKLQGTDYHITHYAQLSEAQSHWFKLDQPVIVVPDASVSLQDLVRCLDLLGAMGVSSVNYGGAMKVAEAGELLSETAAR